ncbi:hypothetical protein [Halovulum sp. GXIMD14793]
MRETKHYGPGHNKGPKFEPGQGWRRHCWKKARRDLIGTVPLEIVRGRMRRAKELGLAYPQYASILKGAGRDVTAFLFTHQGLRLKLARRLEMPTEVREKLSGLIRCDRRYWPRRARLRMRLPLSCGRSAVSTLPGPGVPPV